MNNRQCKKLKKAYFAMAYGGRTHNRSKQLYSSIKSPNRYLAEAEHQCLNSIVQSMSIPKEMLNIKIGSYRT